jgi:hypothetical protein
MIMQHVLDMQVLAPNGELTKCPNKHVSRRVIKRENILYIYIYIYIYVISHKGHNQDGF